MKILTVLYPFSYGVKRFLLINMLIGISAMGLSFIQPLFYKLFIDDVILKNNFNLIRYVITGYIVIFMLNLLFSYIKKYSTNRLINRITFRAKIKIWHGFLAQDFISYESTSVGDMKMRLDDDTACINSYADAQTVDYIISYITIIVSALLLLFIEWRLALFSFIAIPLTFWLDHITAKREAKEQNKQRENDQKMSSWLHSSIRGWREVKALNLGKHEERQFARFIHQYAIYFGTWINYWVVRVLVIPKIKEEFLMQFLLYFFGGLLIISGHFEIGSLLVFMQYYGILSNAVKTVSSTDAELLSSTPQSDRMITELSKTYMKKIHNKIVSNNDTQIEFKNVSFAYQNTKADVLNDVSFIIKSGERTAITGRSGVGKTTVLKLMMGMLKPSSGQVLYSGIDLSEIHLSCMHRHIGFVMQENALFNTSIKENLLYGNEKATDIELNEACRKAFILDYINTLPNGMDTIIGEQGIKLSGGQKQRIVLARLFLRDVDVFIFDEATSALDQFSESIIHDAIESISRDKTIIVVAHRESSLSLCNRVITL